MRDMAKESLCAIRSSFPGYELRLRDEILRYEIVLHEVIRLSRNEHNLEKIRESAIMALYDRG